jgi:asparagine synthase (glutamine-hydrolysing)
MSGIVGVVHLDGAPVDRALMERLTGFLAFRGPDATAVHVDGPIGLGHALLRTDPAAESQPGTLDGQVWITADARLDGRDELIERLALEPARDAVGVPDVMLILRAYARWGEACLEHLRGDFTFGLWDGARRCLLCARDQLGVRPLFYSRVGPCLLFSNTLDALRLHPRISDRLNEAALGDFLLFEQNCNLETTTFTDIQRLPAAHLLTASARGVQTRRYWSFPRLEIVRDRRPEECLDQFRVLLHHAVADRVRGQGAGLFLSGGLDSTTLAATAVGLGRDRRPPLALHAVTAVYDHLIPDRERHYAGLAARSLGIPLHVMAGDGYALYQGWDQADWHTPEPCHEPLAAFTADLWRHLAARGPVAIDGEGGDAALATTSVAQLLARRPWGEVAVDVARCLWTHRTIPLFGSGLSACIRRWQGRAAARPVEAFPAWIDPGFAARLHLRERWREVLDARVAAKRDVRADGTSVWETPAWQYVLETSDAGFRRVPLEVRFPFLDLRLLGFLFTLPPLPWCVGKYLLRRAMAGRLPAEILARPKTPLAADPVAALVRRGPSPWDGLTSLRELPTYVDVSLLLQLTDASAKQTPEFDELLRPVSLGCWLRHVGRTG